MNRNERNKHYRNSSPIFDSVDQYRRDYQGSTQRVGNMRKDLKSANTHLIEINSGEEPPNQEDVDKIYDKIDQIETQIREEEANGRRILTKARNTYYSMNRKARKKVKRYSQVGFLEPDKK